MYDVVVEGNGQHVELTVPIDSTAPTIKQGGVAIDAILLPGEEGGSGPPECEDPGTEPSGIATCELNVTDDGTVDAGATDRAGNATIVSQVRVEVTGTKVNGWYTAAPTLAVLGTNASAYSVKVGAGAAAPYTGPVTITGEGTRSITVSGPNGGATFSVKVDTKAPTISISPALKSSYNVGENVTITVTCTDPNAPDSSGVQSCTPASVTLNTGSAGNRSFTVTAKDNADNTATQTFNYTVVKPYVYKGFFSPITMGNVLNTANAGSTIPFKFQVFKPDGTQITSTSSVTVTISSPQTCPAYPETPISGSKGGSSFSYDGSQFQQQWKTPKPIPTPAKPCYLVTAHANADPGPGISAWVKLK